MKIHALRTGSVRIKLTQQRGVGHGAASEPLPV
jgi:hypothetical protein